MINILNCGNRPRLLGLGLAGWCILYLFALLGCHPVLSQDQVLLVDETATVPGSGGSVEFSFYAEGETVIMITLEAEDSRMEPYSHLDYPGGWSEYLPALENAWAGFNTGGTYLDQAGVHVLTVFDGSNLGGLIQVRVEVLSGDPPEEPPSTTPEPYPGPIDASATRAIFLHHSTGEIIWNGGTAEWIDGYNQRQGTNIQVDTRAFPQDYPYGWENYPYDYWNIWVNHAGPSPYREEPTLEILTRDYELIIWKHCFPVSNIEGDTGFPEIGSSDKRLEHYFRQYQSLKTKMHEFPDTLFLVWTGAAQVSESTSPEEGQRARRFFDWVKNEWDERGDNIYVWDFFELETEGGLYLKPEYAAGAYDAHPDWRFAERVAPLFGRRVVDVLEGRGDSGSLTGE